LLPADYHAHALEVISGDETPDALAERDLLLTDGVLELASHLAQGKVDAAAGVARWRILEEDLEPLEDALSRHALLERLSAAAAHGPEYERFRAELARARTAGDRSAESSLRATLERLRWEPGPPPSRRIDVDLPGFRLTLLEPGDEPEVHRVMIGTSGWTTPAMTSSVVSVVLNPSWTVPRRIVEEELLERIRSDPAWLERSGFRVYRDRIEVPPAEADWSGEPGDLPYTLVQSPGAANPLGLVKLVFPNREAIYLHDTPQRALFTREPRTFTHGCVRVERATALAARLLDMPESALLALAADGETRVLPLPDPIPIHLRYRTAAVEPDDTVSIRADVYGLDRRLLESLDASAW
jgi:murein L,D-transpeptidase YcbB/YkuD